MSCSSGPNIALHDYKHFKYACTLASAGKNQGHVIYLEGYEYGTDNIELQNFALYYVKDLKFKSIFLKIINKKATSMDHLHGNYRIAHIRISCFNDKAYITRITIYKDGKRSVHISPNPIDRYIEVKCYDE